MAKKSTMTFLKPFILQEKWQRIAIVQTSEDGNRFPERYSRALAALRRTFTGTIRDYTQYSSACHDMCSGEVFAELFHCAVQENDLILSLTGGYTTNLMLPHLDYNLLREKCPLLVGYSDTTALQLAFLACAQLCSLYGPALLGSFGEYPDVNPVSLASMKALTMFDSAGYHYSAPALFADCNYFWDKEDAQPVPYSKNRVWHSNSDDCIRGILFGGNLNTLLCTIGTEFFPKIPNGILFLEDTHTCLSQLKRDIESLRQRHVFDNLRGVLFGKFYQCGLIEDNANMNNYLLREFTRMGLPLMVDVDFGHCLPQLSLPLGIEACVDYQNGCITLCESFARKKTVTMDQ